MLRAGLLALFLATIARADELPSWAFEPPPPTAQFRYFVGRSGEAATDAQAIDLAAQNAVRQAIALFGVTAEMTAKSYESMMVVETVTASSEASRRVHLDGFEVQKTALKPTAHGWSAWILYRYDQAAIATERKRLATTSEAEKHEFSEIGNPRILAKGQIEILTDPAGATVLVDGKETLAKTPLRLSGVLETGLHAITLDHPGFVAVTRTILVEANQKAKIDETLIPAKGFLTVSTEPPGAVILLDGQKVGVTPIEHLPVRAERKVTLYFVHLDTDPMTTEVSVSRDEDRILNYSLKLKPARLQIATMANAHITIDGSQVKPGWLTVTPGSHEVKVFADGFESQDRAIVLRGGEDQIEHFKLQSHSELEQSRLNDLRDWDDHLANSPWIIGLGVGSAGRTSSSPQDLSTFGYSLWAEKRFSGLLGLRGTLGYLGGRASDSNQSADLSDTPTHNVSGFSGDLSLPFQIRLPAGALYLAPDVGWVTKAFSCSNEICPGDSISQIRYGELFGYQGFWGRIGVDGNIGYFSYGNSGSVQGAGSAAGSISFVCKF